MTDLDPKATFETFVVGPANRLACAAARRAAESPGTAYNPLFLYSSSGLGKSHILSAVAHQAQRIDESVQTRYQTIEGFLDDLTAALEAGERDRLKETYRSLDILLLDDIQFLAGQPEAQEMLLATLDALTASGSQVVLASDRPPAEINGLDARLVSRFSGGLIVDIAPPEYETRVAIIRRRTEERGQTLEKGVAEALARHPFQNVRELGGALNRVLATQELDGRRVTAGDIPSLMGEQVAVTAGADLSSTRGSGGAVSVEVPPVDSTDPPWMQALREAADEAEAEGYSAARLKSLLATGVEPEDWQARLDSFRRDVARIGEIAAELRKLKNPWAEAATSLVRDPDRREEAEAFLVSVRERVRPFPRLPEGPDLDAVRDHYPTLIVRAADQLVARDRPKYNPLYLWTEDGDSAVRLAAAAGRTFRAGQPDARMAVTSVQEFSADFIRALSEGVAGAWRERWWTLDLLLIHGLEALSEAERAQDEFFHLFEALKRRGARVLLAAACPPSDLENIDDRLRSRFEGGLVLEIEGAEDMDSEVALGLALSEAAVREWESGWEDVSRRSGDAGAGNGGAPPPETPSPEAVARPSQPSADPLRWFPSREQVIWVWPSIEERLVEELD